MPGLPIRTPADIGTARNVLRRRIAGPRYTPGFRARAAATFTALAEFILTTQGTGLLDLNMLSHDTAKGIELHCSIDTADDWQARYDALVEQVSEVVSDIECFRSPDHLRIVARIWLRE